PATTTDNLDESGTVRLAWSLSWILWPQRTLIMPGLFQDSSFDRGTRRGGGILPSWLEDTIAGLRQGGSPLLSPFPPAPFPPTGSPIDSAASGNTPQAY